MTIEKRFGTHTLKGPNKNENEIVYGVDETVTRKKCRLILNGFTCNKKAMARGLCPTHYSRFVALKDGSIDLYALPYMEGTRRAVQPEASK